jgi:tetratricopeptide (TPR) repeat protein
MQKRLAALPLVVCVPLFAAGIGTDTLPEALMANGYWKQARAIVEPALKSNPQDAQLLHLMSRVRWAFGDHKTAVELSDRAIAIDGNKAAFHAHAAFMYGQMLNDAGGVGKVIVVRHFKREVDATLALDGKNIEALLMRAVFLAAAPRVVGGDFRLAEQIAESLPKIDPEKGNVALGRYAYNLRDWGRAERAYIAALAANPRSHAATLALANLYCCIMDQPRWDAAEQRARETIKLNPGRGDAYAILAAALAQGQRWTELDAVVAVAEQSVPDDLSPLFTAAKVLRASGKDLPRAERFLRKYVSQEPEGDTPTSAAARWELALVLEKRGRRTDAARELEIVVSTHPELVAAKADLKRLR